MQPIHPILPLLRRLWGHLSPHRRKQFALLLLLIILSSFTEVVSIGTVLPFLGVLMAPERVFAHPFAQPLIDLLGLTDPGQLLLPLTIIFGLAALSAGAMRLLLLWAQTRLSYTTGAELSFDVYRRTLYQPYAVHVGRNSSEVINGIYGKTSQVISNVFLPVLILISTTVMLSAILITLLAVNPIVALAAFGSLGLIYLAIIRLTHKQLLANSQQIAYESTQVIKSLQEGLGGIRDVLINNSQDTYCHIYRNADVPLRRAQGNNVFIGQSPRYAMEAFGMLLIAWLAYWLARQPDGITSAIPVLGALAFGAQRLLPVLQQTYQAWSTIKGGQISLQDTLELLGQPLPGYAGQLPSQVLDFHSEIRLNKVSFSYGEEENWVLRDIQLEIPKGSRIGFIGTTGSGKSTLLDIVMGLLQPTKGTLEVDGVAVSSENIYAWQAHIAHVPQTIFLADSTIEQNIAFGIPKDQIDKERVRSAARQAQIVDAIESWPLKFQTIVGERGVRLSGGQRQRIGIARALYKQADVIIFDEATSALDNETEQAVMSAIDGLDKDLTILIIAHRLTTLHNCTQIIELSDSVIKPSTSYNSIVIPNDVGDTTSDMNKKNAN
jgi:ATP-binding cassette, subfamily B, bacterial PglK